MEYLTQASFVGQGCTADLIFTEAKVDHEGVRRGQNTTNIYVRDGSQGLVCKSEEITEVRRT